MVERAPMADADALHRHAAQHHCIERRAQGLAAEHAEIDIGGMGLARLPAWLAADALAAGTLVRVFEEPKPFGFELNVIRSRSRYLPFKTRVVIDWLAEHLPPLLTTTP